MKPHENTEDISSSGRFDRIVRDYVVRDYKVDLTLRAIDERNLISYDPSRVYLRPLMLSDEVEIDQNYVA